MLAIAPIQLRRGSTSTARLLQEQIERHLPPLNSATNLQYPKTKTQITTESHILISINVWASCYSHQTTDSPTFGC